MPTEITISLFFSSQTVSLAGRSPNPIYESDDPSDSPDDSQMNRRSGRGGLSDLSQKANLSRDTSSSSSDKVR